MACSVKLPLGDVGNGRFARTRQTGQLDNCGLLVLLGGAFSLSDQRRLPMKVGASPQPEGNHPCTEGVIAQAVDHDK
jgi:hypothetical protein